MIQDPHVRLNQSIGYTGTGTTISPPLLPVAFGDAHYRGAVSAWDVAKWSISDWNSIYLSDHWYAILQPGQAVWGAVPNSRQFPGSVKSAAITSVASCSWEHCLLTGRKWSVADRYSFVQPCVLTRWYLRVKRRVSTRVRVSNRLGRIGLRVMRVWLLRTHMLV